MKGFVTALGSFAVDEWHGLFLCITITYNTISKYILGSVALRAPDPFMRMSSLLDSRSFLLARLGDPENQCSKLEILSLSDVSTRNRRQGPPRDVALVRMRSRLFMKDSS